MQTNQPEGESRGLTQPDMKKEVIMSFGEVLQALRKEAKITQEQLANHLGVSAQAVSKWENGSFPEGDLLPRIAEYFQVSIDYLYGREGRRDSGEQLVVDCLNKIWCGDKEYRELEKDYAEQVHRLLWGIQIASWKNTTTYWDRPKYGENDARMGSTIALDSCYTYMGLEKNKDFFLFLRQPEGETGYESWFRDTKAARELFGFIAEPDNLMILGFLYSLKGDEYVSVDTIAKAVSVKPEKVREAVTYLADIGPNSDPPIKTVKIVDGSGEDGQAYGVNIALGGLIVGILILTQTYVNPPQGFTMQTVNKFNSWVNRSKMGKIN